MPIQHFQISLEARHNNMYRLLTILFVYLLASAPLLVRAAELQSPLKFPDLSSLIEGLLRSIVYISFPIISLFVVYAGFKFLTAQGNETKLTSAKENIRYVILGALLILGAWALAQLLGGTVNELRG